MKPSRPNGAPGRTAALGCLAPGLLGIVMLAQPNLAAAADSRGDVALSVVRGPSSERREMPEVASGGAVVLRGTRPVYLNASQSASGQGGGAVGNREAGLAANSGWDRDFDIGGLNYSTPYPLVGVIGGVNP